MVDYAKTKVSSQSPLLIAVFSFQAEDGIRVLVRSRGLGDVYKRQGVVGGGVQQVAHGQLPRASRYASSCLLACVSS